MRQNYIFTTDLRMRFELDDDGNIVPDKNETETLTNRESRWTGLSYDDLCKVVNDAYRGNPDIPIRTLANDLGVPFDIVWECLSFRDYFDFEETRGD